MIAPVLELLSDYEAIVLGDGEFGSVKLAYWLCQKQVKFILRVKQGRYIQSGHSDYSHFK
nr:transposase [Microcoleus asticus]